MTIGQVHDMYIISNLTRKTKKVDVTALRIPIFLFYMVYMHKEISCTNTAEYLPHYHPWLDNHSHTHSTQVTCQQQLAEYKA